MGLDLIILGAASATPTSNQFTTAQLLKMREHYFLIDCGEGTQKQLRRSKTKFSRINHIFISHFFGRNEVWYNWSLNSKFQPFSEVGQIILVFQGWATLGSTKINFKDIFEISNYSSIDDRNFKSIRNFWFVNFIKWLVEHPLNKRKFSSEHAKLL